MGVLAGGDARLAHPLWFPQAVEGPWMVSGLISSGEAARRLGVDEGTILDAVKAGVLQGEKVFGRWVLKEEPVRRQEDILASTISLTQAARAVDLSYARFAALVRRGVVPSTTFLRRQRRVRAADLEAWAARRTGQRSEPQE